MKGPLVQGTTLVKRKTRTIRSHLELRLQAGLRNRCSQRMKDFLESKRMIWMRKLPASARTIRCLSLIHLNISTHAATFIDGGGVHILFVLTPICPRFSPPTATLIRILRLPPLVHAPIRKTKVMHAMTLLPLALALHLLHQAGLQSKCLPLTRSSLV